MILFDYCTKASYGVLEREVASLNGHLVQLADGFLIVDEQTAARWRKQEASCESGGFPAARRS